MGFPRVGVPLRGARRPGLAALAAAGSLACGDALGVESVLGIWNTESINGHVVPGVVTYEGDTYDTRYVRWAFYQDGLCTLTQLVDEVTTTYDQCEYMVNAERGTVEILLLWQPWSGTVEGRSMTLTDPQEVVWLLRAQ